jgi:hypothetical protein
VAVLLSATSSLAVNCVGDCDGGGSVTVNEMVVGVNIALDRLPVDACECFDRDGSTGVEIDELVAAVHAGLSECPAVPTATPEAPTATASMAEPPSETPSPALTATPTPSPDATDTVVPTSTESATPPAFPTCTGAMMAVSPTPASPCVPTPGVFVDCLATSGLDRGPYGGQNGAAVADVDGDGFPDVFFWNPQKRSEMFCDDGTSTGFGLFRNLGHDMQFERIGDSSFVALRPTTIVAAAFGDLDNDGRPDLVVSVDKDSADYTTLVYRNLGGFRFEQVNEAWGFNQIVSEPIRPFGIGVSLVDLNFDGRLDVVEYRRDPEARPLAFISQPDGTTWQEAGRDIFGDARGYTWTVFFTDANHDQLLDAFTLNDFVAGAPSKYFARVDRSLQFEQRYLLPVFAAESYGAPMGGATADLNGDGELELVVTDTGDQHVFSLGEPVEAVWGVQQNPSRFGLLQNCWSVGVVDLENDGRPDLFFTCAGFEFGVPDIAVSFVLRNNGGTFEVAAGILPNEDVPSWDEGLAVADFDQDGRLDLLTGGEQGAPRLLWNQIPGGRALAIRLKGKRVNSQGVGARIDVEAVGLPHQAREVFPGGATWGYSDTQLLFGLGQAAHATVTVDWRPAGGTAVQTVELPPGAWVIEEPEPQP